MSEWRSPFGEETGVAEDFQGLVGSTQFNDVREFELRRVREREEAEALREEQKRTGELSAASLTPSELIVTLDGDKERKEKARVKLEAEMNKINRESEAAVAATKEKEKEHAAGQTGKYPAPILTE